MIKDLKIQSEKQQGMRTVHTNGKQYYVQHNMKSMRQSKYEGIKISLKSK